MLEAGNDGTAIVAVWQTEVAQFKARRARYLLY
jgi:ATP-dependent Clp protease adapter protein ClpS